MDADTLDSRTGQAKCLSCHLDARNCACMVDAGTVGQVTAEEAVRMLDADMSEELRRRARFHQWRRAQHGR